MLDHAFVSGYSAGRTEAAEKVKEAFKNLPITADAETKDLLLDLYNNIVKQED
jgi:hypothetical protein